VAELTASEIGCFLKIKIKTIRAAGLNQVQIQEQNAHNKCQQADLCKLSPFLQKDAKMPPSYPSRCGRRYVLKIELN